MRNNQFDPIELDIDLALILNSAPGYIYWKDLNSVYLGCNENLSIVSGLSDPQEICGKTDYDFSWGEQEARQFIADDQFVIRSGQTHVSEYTLPMKNSNGLNYVVRTEKKPLFNKPGKIIGVLAIAVDITDHQEAERLKQEKLEEQEKFVKTVLQVVHDIRSPLVIIDILSGETSHFPEDQRIMIRNATQRINAITNNLLDAYKSTAKNTIKQELPVYIFLSRLFSEKQLQYFKLDIQLKLTIAEEAYFAFTVFNLSDLQRILSNLINNAVEAIVKEGLITIGLSQELDKIILTIEDNGKGIPQAVLDKLGHVGMSYDKADGTGLGLAHAIETIKKQNGDFKIESQLGQGSQVTITLPKIETPHWFADKLTVQEDSLILIIDDDPSIHYLWDKKFKALHIKNPVHHFHSSHELVQWMTDNSENMSKAVLLSDNELIGSELTGLQLIEQYQEQIQSSLLVTSYYAFHELASELIRINTQILPKELVMQVVVGTP